MPNRNYERGREAEYAAIRDLRRLGFDAQRTAGSHGPYDVIGMSAGQLVLCQCKRGSAKPSPAEYRSLVDLAVPPGTLKLVLYYPDGVGAVRSAAVRVLYSSGALPDWCGSIRWLEGMPPRQKALRLPC